MKMNKKTANRMNIKTKEINDSRSVGFGVFEIASFPILEGSKKITNPRRHCAMIYNSYLLGGIGSASY
jgi:hypothetical protein